MVLKSRTPGPSLELVQDLNRAEAESRIDSLHRRVVVCRIGMQPPALRDDGRRQLTDLAKVRDLELRSEVVPSVRSQHERVVLKHMLGCAEDHEDGAVADRLPRSGDGPRAPRRRRTTHVAVVGVDPRTTWSLRPPPSMPSGPRTPGVRRDLEKRP